MLTEVMFYLNCRPGHTYVDGTLGGAGHATAICDRIAPDGVFIGIDQDIDAINHATVVLHKFDLKVHLQHGNFVRLPEYLSQLNIAAVDGILLDLGLSQHQLENSGRGFSFKKDEPLDMRMDIRASQTAEQLVNNLALEDLQKLFREYGEERWAKQIARGIVKFRRQEKIRTSKQLAQLVASLVPGRAASKQKIHPATRVFMALRIAVNRELERLAAFMDFAVDYLNSGGRLCVLSFHSLEDRIVKQRLKGLEKGCQCPPKLPRCICGQKAQIRILTKKVGRPTVQEIAANPMARSTRLRAAEKQG
jgi:16S rRNA (cytosine1402-N4)-methyltransferase